MTSTFLTCPYDSNHMIEEKRFYYHLVKCQKNHPDKKLKVCPFNAKHRIPIHNFKTHIINCPDAETITKDLMTERFQKHFNFTGCMATPTYNNGVGDPSECWDEEIRRRPEISLSYMDAEEETSRPSSVASFASNLSYRQTCLKAFKRMEHENSESRCSTSLSNVTSSSQLELRKLRLPKDYFLQDKCKMLNESSEIERQAHESSTYEPSDSETSTLSEVQKLIFLRGIGRGKIEDKCKTSEESSRMERQAHESSTCKPSDSETSTLSEIQKLMYLRGIGRGKTIHQV